MRLSLLRPPLRAIILIAVGWIGLRLWLLWPERAHDPVGPAPHAAATASLAGARNPVREMPAGRAVEPPSPAAAAIPIHVTATRSIPAPAVAERRAPASNEAAGPLLASEPNAPQPKTAPAPSFAPTEPTVSAPRRWSGWAYLFYRPGSGRTLAAGGQLGGSQAAARVAYRLDHRLAVAARAYAPLRDRGAEAALGLDAIVFGPIHAVIERRAGIDRQGRDAWAAYTTGGIYRETGRLVVDAYAQAGVVGARRRDLFGDAAVRAGLRLGKSGPIIGAGAWGAAQPGARRIDIGPRAAWTEPRTRLTASIEGRFRIAGAARPGSGVALTLGRDF